MKLAAWAFFLLIYALGAPLVAYGETYPNKPIRLLVGYAAGSALDLRARQISERLAKSLGQSIVVENRVGAGGTLAVGAATKAPADGYTLLYAGTGELAAAPSLYPQLPYDPIKDLSPIGQAVRGPAILLTNPATGIKSVQDLVSRAKGKPSTMTAASLGNGSVTHLVLLELMTEAGIELIHVPYKSAAQALTDLMGGQVDVMFDFALSARPHIQAGKLVPLMVVGANRLSVLPDIRTAKEVGFPGVNLYAWNGLLAPRGTPKAIVEQLSKEFLSTMRSPEMQKVVAESGSQLVASTPDEFARQIEGDIARIRDIVKRTGAQLD